MQHILYTFRRCPYCMRAHLALKSSGITGELREVLLSDMPEQALSLSAKGTVPVLHTDDGEVIDESWDIAKWALLKNDPDNLLGEDNCYLLETEMLVEINDFSFKPDLDRYKYADRHPEHDQSHYREACEEFIIELEERLSEHRYLLSDEMSVADIAIFPFVRQFSMVEDDWFINSPYPNVRRWLKALIATVLFQKIFRKQEPWKPGDTAIYF